MSISRLALYHVETLIWIDRLGSFSAAAARLNASQPAISARVREVEAQLGVTLFRREGRQMQLTPVGRRLVQQLGPLWDDVQAVFGTTGSAMVGAPSLVRIGAGEIAAASCLPDFVSSLSTDMPTLTLKLDIDLTASLFSRLLAGEIDVAFTAGPLAHPAICATPIGVAPLRWLASPQVAAQWSNQSAGRMPAVWSLSEQSPLFQLMRDALRQSGISQSAIHVCNNVRMMIDIVAAGGGIGLFPGGMVAAAMAQNILVPLDHLPTPSPVPFNAAIRAAETDAVVLEIFRRAGQLSMA